MADGAPPSRIRRDDVHAEFVTLAAGTRAWRVHRRDAAELFNPHPHVEPFGGGRFDSNLSYRYPYSYVGLEPQTALTENLLRAVPFQDNGGRVLPPAAVKGRRLITVRTTHAVTLLDLCSSTALASVYADEWLIHCEPVDYPKTRAWGHWLRELVPSAMGFIWPSKRNVGGRAVILFGDRCPGALEWDAAQAVLELDDRDGVAELNERLRPYRATVRRPRT
jgi:hypothetical protein